MPRKYRPNWEPKDAENLQRAINKFNRKLARLEKANPDLKGFLPERAKFSFYRSAINNKVDLKREISALNRFSKKGSEELIDVGEVGAKMTKWQMRESKRREKLINTHREKRLNYILGRQVKTEGVPHDYTKANMGISKMDLRQYEPINITYPSMRQEDVNQKWKTIVNQSSRGYYKKSDYQWRDNYIKSLEDNFGSNADEVIDKIKFMSIEKFKDTMYGDTEAGIEFNYIGNFGEAEKRLPQLYRIWEVPESEKLDESIDRITEFEEAQRSISVPNDIEYYNVKM